jgi:hypothetical protein
MTQILLLGLVHKGTGPQPSTEPHLHLPVDNWEALALPLDASNKGPHKDEAAQMLDWATRQNAVLAAYVHQTDVVPIALGAVFSGPAALQDHLVRNAGILEQAAKAVAGHCEYAPQIRAKDDSSEPQATKTGEIIEGGAQFLHQRRTMRDIRLHMVKDRQSFVRQVAGRLTTLVTRACPRDLAGKALLADLSLLVSRTAEQELITTLTEFSERSNSLGLALRLIGPSPAYSFVSDYGADKKAINTVKQNA